MSRSRIPVLRVMEIMCLPFPMHLGMRALRENATIYCHKFGHKNIDCKKLKVIQENKGNHWVNVCFKSNVINMPSDTWWLDSGATIHACNYVHAMIRRMSPTSLEQHVFMGDGIRVQVSFLGVVRLHLSTIFFLIEKGSFHTIH